MTLLSGIASRGTTVLCSLHQPRPRVVGLLDKVMLLSGGRVAYFGGPGDAEPFFRSIGRPFPRGQPHPADAMLTLCCREDGRDLPSLFRRSRSQLSSEAWSAAPAAPAADAAGAAAAASVKMMVPSREQPGSQAGRGGAGDADPAGSAAGSRTLNTDDASGEQTELVEVGLGPGPVGSSDGGGGEWEALRRRAQRGRQRPRQRPTNGSAVATGEGVEKLPAPFLVQVEALSRRLLLRAVRHPLLLVLHFGGSVAMALCLASVFGGQLGYNLAGAQNRQALRV